MSKPKNTCLHVDKISVSVKNSIYDNINFCKECQGINIKAKNEAPVKSVSYFNERENLEYINPLILYHKMRINDVNYSLIYENSYCSDRKNIINFITKLTNKYKVSEESYYLSILYLDFIISQIPKTYSELDSLAIGAFFLAAKFIENDAYLGSFTKLTSNLRVNLYSIRDLRESEVFCLKALNFNLSRTTAKQYLDLMSQIGFLFDDELNFLDEESPITFYFLGFKLLKDFISNFESTQFSSVIIAFSILVFVREFHIKYNFRKQESPERNESKDFKNNKLLNNNSDLKKFLIMKRHRIKIFENIYNVKENSYIKCFEKMKNLRNMIEFDYGINDADLNHFHNHDYDNNSNNNNNNKHINNSMFNSPLVKKNNEYSNDIKSFNLNSSEKSIKEIYMNNNPSNNSDGKTLSPAYGIKSYNGQDSNHFNHDELKINSNKSYSQSKNTNEFRNFNALESREKLNYSDKKPLNQTAFKTKLSRHKNTLSCIDSYLINQITNGFNINEENTDSNLKDLSNINEDYNCNIDLKEKSKIQSFKSLNPQIQFKSNTSMKLINLSILQSSKNKITQYLNENIRKDGTKLNIKNQNSNTKYSNNNIKKSIDLKSNKVSEFNNGSIEFILSQEDTVNVEKVSSVNKNNLRHNLKSYEVLSNLKNPIFPIEQKTNFKVEESKFNNAINKSDNKVISKDSAKNLRVVEIRNKINSINCSSKNKNTNNYNNNNFLHSYRNIQEKARKYSDNFSVSNKNDILKLYYNNNLRKEGKNFSQQKTNVFKNKPNSDRSSNEREYRNVLSQNSKGYSNNDNSDNSTSNNSLKEINVSNIKNVVKSHCKITTKFLNLRKNSGGSFRKYSHHVKNEDSIPKKITIINLSKIKDMSNKDHNNN